MPAVKRVVWHSAIAYDTIAELVEIKEQRTVGECQGKGPIGMGLGYIKEFRMPAKLISRIHVAARALCNPERG